MAATSRAHPLVSIVIPAYNAADYVGETLETVLAQTYENTEIIVVDDGSTDETAHVVADYTDAVRYFYKQNGGSASARNRGIREARGRYIAFLDADDRWKPEKLERQIARFVREPDLAWSYTDSLLVDSQTGEVRFQKSQIRERPEGDIFEKLLLGNFVAPSTTVVRSDVFDAVGHFEESRLHRISEDWDLWLRIAAEHPIGFVPEPLVITWHHPHRKTETMDLDQAFRSRSTIIRRAMERRREVPESVRSAARANLHVSMGRKWLNRDDRLAARRHFLKALSHQTLHPEAWQFLIASFLPRHVLRQLGEFRQRVRSLKRAAQR